MIAVEHNSSSSESYHWTDKYPSVKNNYYRIKSIGINGEIQYSKVVNVIMGANTATISVYPNPVVNGTVNVHLVNQPAGNYYLKLLNNRGQVVQVKEVDHKEGSSTEIMQLNKSMPKGTYVLEVNNAGNNKTTINVLY